MSNQVNACNLETVNSIMVLPIDGNFIGRSHCDPTVLLLAEQLFGMYC